MCRGQKRRDRTRKVVQFGKSAGMACDKKQESSPCVALRCRCDPLLVTDSTTRLQHLRDLPVLGTGLSAGCQGMQPLGLSCLPTLGRGISTLALCFSAPAEGRSCSRLSPWVFLVSALAVKTALVTIGLGGFQGPFTSPGMKGTVA